MTQQKQANRVVARVPAAVAALGVAALINAPGTWAAPERDLMLAQAQQQPVQQSPQGTPQTVGERPEPEEPQRPQVQALAQAGGVLTRKGQFVFEPSVTYTNAQVNRFSFTGVEILETFLIGVLEAQDVDRDILRPAIDLRYGLTNRLEVGLKVPYVYREETRSATIPQASSGGSNVPIEQDLDGEGIGDVELTFSYQLNQGDSNGPWYIANLRYKSTTGTGPFEVDYNADAIETELANGSGFHGVELSLTTLYRSDPAVLYGNLGYLYNIADDVDRTLGSGNNAVRVGRVDPGDSIRTSFGLSVSLNPRTSFSLGYQHDFIRETDTELNNTRFESESLSVGSLSFGVTQVLSNNAAATVSVELGATADAPDATITLRVPFTLGG